MTSPAKAVASGCRSRVGWLPTICGRPPELQGLTSGLARDTCRRYGVSEQTPRSSFSTAIFVKAFAVVAAEVPELRRAYMKWPCPHLYEYADSTVSVLQGASDHGRHWALPIRFRKPDAVPLGELSGMICRSADAPIGASKLHRDLIALAKCPLIIRRLVWELCLNIPRLRRHTLGTYGVSSVARWQTELGTSRTPLPCLLSCGPTDLLGQVIVRLTKLRPSHLRRRAGRPCADAARSGLEFVDPRRTAGIGRWSKPNLSFTSMAPRAPFPPAPGGYRALPARHPSGQ